MRWLRRRRDREARARRHSQLRLALDARESLLVAVDKSANVDVLIHALNAVTELDAAIALLAERVPELRDEAANLRSALFIEDRVPEGWRS